MRLRTLLFLPVVAAVLALSACGDSSTSTSTATSTSSTSGVAADIKQECLDATQRVSDARARAAAERGCDALASSPDVSAALVKARTTCLEAAAKLPAATLQTTAINACNKISTAAP